MAIRSETLTRWILPALAAGLMAVFAIEIVGAPPADRVFVVPLLIAGAVLVVIVTIRLAVSPPQPETPEAEAGRARLALAMLALIGGLMAGIHLIGFFESALVFLVAAMWLLGERRLQRLVGVPLTLLAGAYLLFVVALGARFPPSVLGLD